MRIAVIGAGIIGVTTAYELAIDGHEVSVFERSGSVAAEGSFANAGVMAPGIVAALGHPATARLSGALPARWGWRWRRWRAARSGSAEARMRALLDLSAHSLEQVRVLRQQLGLDYEHTPGHLLLLRSASELAALQPGLALLQQLGQPHQQLSAAQCQRAEPGLNAETALHAGVLLAQAEVGNCRQFAILLRQQAQRLGVRFRFHTTVQRLESGSSPQLLHAYTPPSESPAAAREAAQGTGGPATQPLPSEPVQERFDAVVVCAAAGSTALLQALGLKLPVTPIFGYSITAPLRQLEAHPDLGPRAALLDARHQVTISRIGQRVRVAGVSELGSTPGAFDQGAIESLHKVLHDWFPGAVQGGAIQRWKGARPTLPDGAPLLGASGVPGIWLNLGHGNQGWALACGSARLVADQISGRQGSIGAEVLGVSRLR